MGLRSAAMACQRITSAVCFICEAEGHHTLSYLDDFIGVAPPDTAWQAYEHCGHLLEELGLEESPTKDCPPSTIATCLGVQFDTVQMTMSVTQERLAEIESLLSVWSVRGSATKSELQSLVGKLSFVSKCVRHSTLFLAWILALLRTLKRNHYRSRLTGEFRKDIAWWLRFMRSYNGVSIISSLSWTAPDTVFSTDASIRMWRSFFVSIFSCRVSFGRPRCLRADSFAGGVSHFSRGSFVGSSLVRATNSGVL